MTEKRGVFVAIPTVGRMLTADIGRLLFECGAASNDPDCPHYFQWNAIDGATTVDYVRNLLVECFLETKCDRLLFLDYDVLPPPDWMKLLDIDADIAAGLYFHYDHDEERRLNLIALQYQRGERGFDTLRWNGEDVRSVDAAGCGAMLIRRRVIEDDRMKLAAGNGAGLSTAWFRNEYRPDGKLAATEDLGFCWRARELGYEVKVWQARIWGHLKRLDLREVAELVARHAAEKG